MKYYQWVLFYFFYSIKLFFINFFWLVWLFVYIVNDRIFNMLPSCPFPLCYFLFFSFFDEQEGGWGWGWGWPLWFTSLSVIIGALPLDLLFLLCVLIWWEWFDYQKKEKKKLRSCCGGSFLSTLMRVFGFFFCKRSGVISEPLDQINWMAGMNKKVKVIVKVEVLLP